MTLVQIVNIIVVGLLPFLILLSIHIEKLFAQRLPSNRVTLLEQFVHQSVRKIEKQYPKNPSKKALAEAEVAILFKAYKQPLPPKEAIDTAIESAVFSLPDTKDRE